MFCGMCSGGRGGGEDSDSTAVAKRFWSQSPHGSKIQLRLAPALETLQTLAGPFDLIFVDADKINYVNYFQRALDLIADQGIILIDNVLWNGDVLKSPAPDSHTAAIQELNRVVHAEPRVSAVLLTIRDGIFLITPLFKIPMISRSHNRFGNM